MGMITRVRGRLRSLHTLPKLDEKVRDERIAETGKCFLKPKLDKSFTINIKIDISDILIKYRDALNSIVYVFRTFCASAYFLGLNINF